MRRCVYVCVMVSFLHPEGLLLIFGGAITQLIAGGSNPELTQTKLDQLLLVVKTVTQEIKLSWPRHH